MLHCTTITLPTAFSNTSWIHNRDLWIDTVASTSVTITNTTIKVSCNVRHCRPCSALFAIGF